MTTWTNKHWGAVIGGLVVLLIAIVGVGTTALVVLFAIIGYFIGKFLDGEVDLEDIRARAQGRAGSQEPGIPPTPRSRTY